MKVDQPAFRPVAGATVNIAAGTTTASVAVNTGKTSKHIRVVNTGSVTVFVEFGESGVTASLATSIPILAGSAEIFGCPDEYVAAITASGTGTVYFTPGEGM